MGAIRIEADGTSDLARAHQWMTRHRGQVVQLDGTRQLRLGVPITGARAVIVAAVLEAQSRHEPQLGGVLRALSSRTSAEPVRLVFEGRSPGGLTPGETETVAAALLKDVDAQIASDELEAKVA